MQCHVLGFILLPPVVGALLDGGRPPDRRRSSRVGRAGGTPRRGGHRRDVRAARHPRADALVRRDPGDRRVDRLRRRSRSVTPRETAHRHVAGGLAWPLAALITDRPIVAILSALLVILAIAACWGGLSRSTAGRRALADEVAASGRDPRAGRRGAIFGDRGRRPPQRPLPRLRGPDRGRPAGPRDRGGAAIDDLRRGAASAGRHRPCGDRGRRGGHPVSWRSRSWAARRPRRGTAAGRPPSRAPHVSPAWRMADRSSW